MRRQPFGVRQAVTPVNFVWAGPLLDIAFLPRPPHPHEAAWYTSKAPQGAFLLRGKYPERSCPSECWVGRDIKGHCARYSSPERHLPLSAEAGGLGHPVGCSPN